MLLLISPIVNSQEVTCSELREFIEEKGWNDSSLNSYTLESSWLYKVTKYRYNFKNYIIAEIKTDEYSSTTRTYIFCDIPDYNWSGFKQGYYEDEDSYGKRFHKYIMDYQCNCN